MTTAKRQTLGDFLYYSLCAGQTKAGPYGYSPLPLNLVQAGFEQISKLKAADPAVDLTDRDVKSCNNPTFDGKDLSKNQLAEIAPQPAACDKAGEGPCGTETGTNTPSTDDGSVTPGVTVETPGTPTGPGEAPVEGAPPAPGSQPSVDPDTGEVVASPGTTTGEQSADFAAPTELASGRPVDSATFGWVAALLLVALVLLPGLMVSSFRRRASAGPK
jgi:hypothetical protein